MSTIRWDRHVSRGIILSFVTLLLVCPTSLFAQSEDQQELAISEVLSLYRTGRIDRAELEALRLLNHTSELSADDRSQLYQVLAFIAIAREDPQLGREFFLQAIREKPDLNLDRNLTSPKILSVFDEARADFKRVQIREQDLSEEAMRAVNLRLEGAKRSLVLPGWGQFYKGNREHGYAFLGTAALVGGGLVFSQIMMTDKRDEYHASNDPEEASSLYDEYTSAWDTRNGLAWTLGIVWALNIADALWFPPEVDVVPGSSTSFRRSGRPGTPMIGVAIRF
ncbi:hypothetical protein KQI63_15480 [bacterium]|nr:hypothetical protein [bacterium]